MEVHTTHRYTAYDFDPVSIKDIVFGIFTPLPISKVSKSQRCLKHVGQIFLPTAVSELIVTKALNDIGRGTQNGYNCLKFFKIDEL